MTLEEQAQDKVEAVSKQRDEDSQQAVKKQRVTTTTTAPTTSLPASLPSMPKLLPATNIDHLKPIVWIDCEMTGLDIFNDHIIEICCIITDKDLNIIDETGYESVIHYDKATMDQMGEWCIDHHGSSGLTAKVIESTKTLEQVQEELLTYISKYVSRNKGILAGNSVHMDRLFMCREMPKVINYLFYRIIDVSSIMEVGKRHNPKLVEKCPRKIEAHTAKSDILESIAQLKWYTENYLIGPGTGPGQGPDAAAGLVQGAALGAASAIVPESIAVATTTTTETAKEEGTKTD